MKAFLFISLTLILKISFASLEITGFSGNQLCMFAKDPPISEEVLSQINERAIICDDGVAINESKILINKASALSIRFKRWSKALQGKGPVYSTSSGTNLKVDTFGDEKSITIDRAF
jgi:hypothetical protein